MKDRCLETGARPNTIEEIKELVEELAEEIPENDIRMAVSNIRKRARKCLEEGDRPAPTAADPHRRVHCPGGHFQHLVTHTRVNE